MKRYKLHPAMRAILYGALAGLVVASVVIGIFTILNSRPGTRIAPPLPKPVTEVQQPVVAPVIPQPVVSKPEVITPAIPSDLPLPRYIKNAVPVEIQPGKKLVVVVLDDMGVNAKLSALALQLPRPLTLSFLPYGEASLAQAKKGRELGHEIMVHLPMEPEPRLEEPASNPGPNALMANDLPEVIQQKITRNLKNYLDLAVGVNNHMGSRFTSSKTAMLQALPMFESQELFFLDSLTTPHSAVKAAARELNLTVPLLQRDVFLDHVIGRAEVEQSLLKLEHTAKRQGFAIGIGHPHAITLQALKDWLPTLPEKGIQLVPISFLAQQESPIKHVSDSRP